MPYAVLGKADYVEPATMPRPDKFDIHPYTPPRGIDEIPGFRDKLRQFINKGKGVTLKSNKARSVKKSLNKNERAFLDYLSLKEYEPIHILFSRIGDISAGVQQQIIKKLEELTLIKTTPKIRTGRIFVRFASFTNEGRKYMNK